MPAGLQPQSHIQQIAAGLLPTGAPASTGLGPSHPLDTSVHKMAAAAGSWMQTHGVAHGAGVYSAERTAFRCPGSKCSRGRWKFLWIKPGAEARRAVWVGSALPPHPVPHPLLRPRHHRHHRALPFMPPLRDPSSKAPRSPPSPHSLLWPGRGGLDPLPKFGRGYRRRGGLSQTGGPSDLQVLLCEMGSTGRTRQAVCRACLWV